MNDVSVDVRIEGMSKDIGYIRAKVDSIETKVEQHYVMRAEFDPIKKLVYGFVGLVLIAVSTALIALVVVPRV